MHSDTSCSHLCSACFRMHCMSLTYMLHPVLSHRHSALQPWQANAGGNGSVPSKASGEQIRPAMSDTSNGGMMTASNSRGAPQTADGRYGDACGPQHDQVAQLCLLRLDDEAVSWSLLEINASMCSQMRIMRPMSFCPILLVPFVGEYHVNGVRTPGSIDTAWIEPSACVSRGGTFCISYTQANVHSFILQEYVSLPSVVVGHSLFLCFVSKYSGAR